MQDILDDLYQKSLNSHTKGIDLFSIITSENNIMLAFRNIKSNTGSHTEGMDGLTIRDYKIENKQKFIKEIREALIAYRPQMVRRVEIPKANGRTRPLGIPTMRDRIIQQMFLQVLEPICEAKFYRHSYGFRPNRSTHHALSRCVTLVNRMYCHHVVDVDIKGFFDNVNHSKLLSQLYTIGIKDRRVLAIVGKMLKAPILGEGIPKYGTPQGAILSPLLSNVVLNDLDHWVSNQWENFQTNREYKGHGYDKYLLRKTSKLKEMYIVRYADDFKVFTKDHKQAWKIFHAIKGYLNTHLKLETSTEKSKVTNLRKRSSEFLGFEIKVVSKGNKCVANTHIIKNRKKIIKEKVKELLKRIQKQPSKKNVANYNSYVLGVHNYYSVATHVNIDFSEIAYSLLYTIYNRLKNVGKYEIPRSPPSSYRKFYKGNGRTFKIGNTYLYPLSDIQWKMLRNFTQEICDYTPEGRNHKYKNLNIEISDELRKMWKKFSTAKEQMEYSDNRLSKYSMQNGKCAVTGMMLNSNIAHCHHIIPRAAGGTDRFNNLVIVHDWIHILIHATDKQKIGKYMRLLNLTGKQIKKLNSYREKCNLTMIY